ncbi:hypothetical protein OsI_10734 [Oryza sativa Indica Group]|uniref:RRM domain-containing protein n=1 Tax=Oryza sativa subsp. indica TaxID=39946 RepID=A2XEH7_ORYSI|nr:hypothetical protein OsI_10734 [Oryza sativa Indica Group]
MDGDTTFTKLFVGGLPWETRGDAVRRHFEQFGEIVEAVVIADKHTSRSKGYGFVRLAHLRFSLLLLLEIADGLRIKLIPAHVCFGRDGQIEARNDRVVFVVPGLCSFLLPPSSVRLPLLLWGYYGGYGVSAAQAQQQQAQLHAYYAAARPAGAYQFQAAGEQTRSALAPTVQYLQMCEKSGMTTAGSVSAVESGASEGSSDQRPAS